MVVAFLLLYPERLLQAAYLLVQIRGGFPPQRPVVAAVDEHPAHAAGESQVLLFQSLKGAVDGGVIRSASLHEGLAEGDAHSGEPAGAEACV